MVVLAGEGSFHQYHGGITTGGSAGDREALIREIAEQYQRIRGERYKAPRRRPMLFGSFPDPALRFLEESIRVAGKTPIKK